MNDYQCGQIQAISLKIKIRCINGSLNNVEVMATTIVKLLDIEKGNIFSFKKYFFKLWSKGCYVLLKSLNCRNVRSVLKMFRQCQFIHGNSILQLRKSFKNSES